MAPDAAHVTMLQRSPSYIFSVPGEDKISGLLNRFLPSQQWVHQLARTRNIKLQRVMYKAAKRYPGRIRKLLLGAVKQQLGDSVDMKHFTPSYKPWGRAPVRGGRTAICSRRLKSGKGVGR